MSRGESGERPWRLSDEDEMDDVGYGGGGSYDEEEEEDDGWGSTKRDDSLWEDPDEAALEEEEEAEVVADDGPEDEPLEDEDMEFGSAPARRRPGRPPSPKPCLLYTSDAADE